MNKETILGIDPSLRSTGICLLNTARAEGASYYLLYNGRSKKETQALQYLNKTQALQYLNNQEIPLRTIEITESSDERIFEIVDRISEILNETKPGLVVLEGLAMRTGRTNTLTELAGLNYLIRKVCRDYNIEYLVVPPTTLKKSFTGNGQADKGLMLDVWRVVDPVKLDERLKSNPIKLDERLKSNPIKLDDLADAYALAAYGAVR